MTLNDFLADWLVPLFLVSSAIGLYLLLLFVRVKWSQTVMQAPEKHFGPLNPKIHCPHCHTSGHVHIRQEKVSTGISGGKAAGAVLTGGVSILATGLSKRKWVNQALCTNCKMVWTM